MLTLLQQQMIRPMDIIEWDGYSKGMVLDADEHRVLVAIHDSTGGDLVTWLNKRSDRIRLISDEHLFGQKCPWPFIGGIYRHTDNSKATVTDIVNGYVLYTNHLEEMKSLPIDEFNKRRGYKCSK